MTARECEIIEFRATDKKRDGTPLVTRNGKPMWSVGIQIADRPGVWIDGLIFSDPNGGWQGTKKQLILYTEEFNGQQKPKFKLPSMPRAGGGMSPEQATEMVSLLREIRDYLAEIAKEE